MNANKRKVQQCSTEPSVNTTTISISSLLRTAVVKVQNEWESGFSRISKYLPQVDTKVNKEKLNTVKHN